MLSTAEQLVPLVNSNRRRARKNPLTKKQVRMITEQVAMRNRLGRFTLFPEDLEAMLENEEEA